MNLAEVRQMAVEGRLPDPADAAKFQGPWGYAYHYPFEGSADLQPGDIIAGRPGPYGTPSTVVTSVFKDTGEVYGRYLPEDLEAEVVASTVELVKTVVDLPRHAPGVKESWTAHASGDDGYKIAVFQLDQGQDPAQWAAAWNYCDGSGYHWEARGGVLVGLPKGRPVPAWIDACTGPNPS